MEPHWSVSANKGLIASLTEADSLIRCVPGDDRTNGFFVSCFVRKKPGSDTGGGPSEADTRRKRGQSVTEEPGNPSKKRRGAEDEESSETQAEAPQANPAEGKRKKKQQRKRRCVPATI